MFAVIYRGYLYPGTEKKYQELWRKTARYFIDHRGAYGSCLHTTVDGEWIAYSRWPSKAVRDASWFQEEKETPEFLGEEMSTDMKAVIQDLKKCIDKSRPFQEICMEVTDDLLL